MSAKNMAQGEAQALAVSALSFVAGDDILLPRFLQLTGIEATQIRQAAAEPGFLAGVLQFVAAHEPTLLQYCNETGTKPPDVMAALDALPAGNQSHLTSI